ncbi:uncharacterized protein si:dkey-52l18.4 [Alosa sapidissima]|uniref:uncharacterized protein si:dkey-52l18.4 n=1 Tax=Alosa sapidissima TaxID=34773 RepID=UPI001C09CBEE|nr:uncharacterized protein si:dkey-52l18.4 [Alosa sapidissima]
MGPFLGCYLILTLMYNNWGCCAEECHTVKARRDNKVVSEGRSLLLSCDVQHCGVSGWTGGWGVHKEVTFSFLQASARIHIYNENLSNNSTRLNINFISTNKSDSGAYQCLINWRENGSSNGHVTIVNVTDAHPNLEEQSERRIVSLRVFLLICACISFPLAVALVRCLQRPVSPVVPPRSYFANGQMDRPREPMYAVLGLENVRHQRPQQQIQGSPVMYSSIRL